MALSTGLDEPTLAGPFSLFNNSFIVEFLKPHPSRNATVLMRATYPHAHPSTKTGKAHPQSPPLHLHFDQSESFRVLSGAVGTTSTWGAVDRVWTAEDGEQEVKPWVPHTFWPAPTASEDTVILVWAHPTNVPEPMDWLFFQNLLMLVSDIAEKKIAMNPLPVMLIQHVSATALVWFPTATWLGPLRWWVPWKMQAGFAQVARWCGYTPLTEKYTPKEEWEKYVRVKKE
ncbi:uncharacterized protein BDZ99DRAFT_463077 [Mytilinidion resinicola]|uniref:Cupin type-1 domain-containing protein n=1 Tax=Mytilinidion resinicola TaxID=574789 RepID=A0A6A6YPM6_9PEZI|nr:uncharacterized protein BDZ99DRAFT_463077 [Mytilinidion resinicola]KAF2810503.1 hypothetical protein BDZ99DRAFT_463077 [Mytilinidion resinicola]